MMKGPEMQGVLIRAPRAWVKELRRYALEHDTTLQAIGYEALLEWAQRHRIALPVPRESATDAESDSRAFLVKNAG